MVISFVNIDKSHFISTNYSFATLFDADRRKIIKASYFYAHLINEQKRTAYHPDMIYGTITPSTMRLSNISTFRHIFSLMLPLDKLMFL